MKDFWTIKECTGRRLGAERRTRDSLHVRCVSLCEERTGKKECPQGDQAARLFTLSFNATLLHELKRPSLCYLCDNKPRSYIILAVYHAHPHPIIVMICLTDHLLGFISMEEPDKVLFVF